MKPRAKKFLSNFFFGLFSNDHAIEGSKSNPWWVALIIMILGTFLPVIPLTVNAARTYGASFLDGYTYRFDQNISEVTINLLKNGTEFKVNDDHKLLYYDNGQAVNVNSEADMKPLANYINKSKNQYELQIYYSQRERSGINDLIKVIDERHFKIGSIDIAGEEDAAYAPSYVILYSEGIYTRINKENSISMGNNTYTGFGTDWNHFDVNHELLKSTLPEGKTADTVDLTKTSEVTAMFNNWKEVYNKSYLSQKTLNIWMSTGLFYGIYLALIIFMGLLVFLLTRGKNNMYNYLKFMDCEKIVAWASLSPAILAMIIGFIFSMVAQMIFIILLGLRVMWISMKQLRPQY